MDVNSRCRTSLAFYQRPLVVIIRYTLARIVRDSAKLWHESMTSLLLCKLQ
jgi:hypothetical protein